MSARHSRPGFSARPISPSPSAGRRLTPTRRRRASKPSSTGCSTAASANRTSASVPRDCGPLRAPVIPAQRSPGWTSFKCRRRTSFRCRLTLLSIRRCSGPSSYRSAGATDRSPLDPPVCGTDPPLRSAGATEPAWVRISAGRPEHGSVSPPDGPSMGPYRCRAAEHGSVSPPDGPSMGPYLRRTARAWVHIAAGRPSMDPYRCRAAGAWVHILAGRWEHGSISPPDGPSLGLFLRRAMGAWVYFFAGQRELGSISSPGGGSMGPYLRRAAGARVHFLVSARGGGRESVSGR